MKKSFAFSSSLFCLSFLIGLSFSCKKPTEPTDTTPGFSVSVEDVSCIEAWVRVKSNGMPLPADIVITKNDAPALTFTMSNTDTVVMIDSLLPKQSYTLRAFRSDKTTAIATDECATMDTTSSNFTWQTWTFGDYNPSRLYDVAVIDENNIWAVGEIYMNDSLGHTDSKPYNAIHWNGQKWELKRIGFPGVCGSSTLKSYPAQTIYALEDGQMWVSSTGDKVAILKNGIQIDQFCMPVHASMSVHKFWGTSATNMYAVGENASIAHWDGFNWRKISVNLPIGPSGRTIDFRTITGDKLGNTIWIGGWEGGYWNTALLKLKEQAITTLYYGTPFEINNGTEIDILGAVWTDSPFYTCVFNGGDLLFQNYSDCLNLNRRTNNPITRGRNMKGQSKNDIMFCGSDNLVAHFNGVRINKLNTSVSPNDILYSIDIKNNTSCAVGMKVRTSYHIQAQIHLLKRH